MKHKSERMGHVFYPTGLNLDYINNEFEPSIPDGSMIMFIGESGVDKETLAVQIANNIVKDFESSSIFHDGISENKHKLVENPDGKYIHRNIFDMSFEKLYERVKIMYYNKICRENDMKYDTELVDEKGEKVFKYEPTIYILNLKCMENDNSVIGARIRNTVFQRVAKMCGEVNIILILINTIESVGITIDSFRDSLPENLRYLRSDESLPMGRSPIYLCNYLLRIDKVTEPEWENYHTIKIIKSFFESGLHYGLVLKDGIYKDSNKNE